MKNARIWILLMAAMPLSAWEQGFDLKTLNKFASRATNTVDVALDGSLLQLAAKFLSANDPQETKIRKLVNGLTGIFVKSFEFDKEGQYSESDLDGIRAQLKTPDWSRVVGAKSGKERENAEIFLRANANSVGGLTILVTGPKELTVVQILGSISPEDLSDLGGNFGIPQMSLHPSGKAPKKEPK